MIRKSGVAMLVLSAFLSIIGGLRYLLTTEFMSYHAVIAGKNWAQIDSGLQSIILGMLKIVGGGFTATGLAILSLLIPIRRGETWACWAALAVAGANWVPTQYVTIALRSIALQPRLRSRRRQ